MRELLLSPNFANTYCIMQYSIQDLPKRGDIPLLSVCVKSMRFRFVEAMIVYIST